MPEALSRSELEPRPADLNRAELGGRAGSNRALAPRVIHEPLVNKPAVSWGILEARVPDHLLNHARMPDELAFAPLLYQGCPFAQYFKVGTPEGNVLLR